LDSLTFEHLSTNAQEKGLRAGAGSFMIAFLDCIGRSRIVTSALVGES
jgi:hypothetical protein